MANIVILYSTVDGHTREICRHLQKTVEQGGNRVTLVSVADEASVDLRSFDKIVLGASIRYGTHRPAVYQFIGRNLAILQTRPSAFFSVSVVARKPNKSLPDNNPYLKKFLRQIDWQPTRLAVFAGKIDYQKYTFWDRTIIRCIMWLTRGPTQANACVEFTDWRQVEEFARTIDAL